MWLVEECRRQGWQARCESLEVGCRGFAGRSLCKTFTLLGITGEVQRKVIRSATEAAEKATRWLCIKRAEPWAIAAGTQAGLPGQGCQILKDPEHPMTPGYITDDVSQRICMMCLSPTAKHKSWSTFKHYVKIQKITNVQQNSKFKDHIYLCYDLSRASHNIN